MQQDNIISLAQLSDRDRKWDEHKWASTLLGSRLSNFKVNRNDDELLKLGSKLQQCCSTLKFNLVESGDLKLAHFDADNRYLNRFCKHRICPLCMWRRSIRLRAESKDALRKSLFQFPKVRWLHLTLTIRNIPLSELSDSIDKMNLGWRRWTKSRGIGRQSKLFQSFPAIGWVKSLEITRENFLDDYVHPHFHCLLMVDESYYSSDKYIRHTSQDPQWAYLWQEALNIDYCPSVYINAADIDQKTRQRISPLKKIPEIVKYAAKESDLVKSNSAFLKEFSNQMKNRRCFEIGGELKQFFNIQDDNNLDLIGGDVNIENKVNEVFFRWQLKPIPHYQLVA